MCLILFCSGCIFSNNEYNVDKGDSSNLKITIETNQKQYNISTLTELIIRFALENVGEEKVKVEKRFDTGSNIKLSLFNENNQTIKLITESSTHIIEEVILKPSEKKQFEIDLLSEILVYSNKSAFKWTSGIYFMEAIYTPLSHDTIVSEKISIEIV